jgi:endonuclease/exonuclease/phosphatase family metal-dependent hydrolase
MKLKLVAFLILTMTGTTLWAQKNADSSRIVKVLSFNILHGATTKNDFKLDALAGLITGAAPDLVAMQEVDFKVDRSKRYDLVTELGWRTKMAPLFARAMPYRGGEYGEGILSKLTFLTTRNVALPHLPEEEPRAALEIVTVLPSGDTIAFVGTHFAHEGTPGRVMQAQKINEVFIQNKFPTILAGDLNAIPGSEPMNILESQWMAAYDKEKPEFTYPSDKPRKKIDYVLFYPKIRWKILDRQVICDTIASDHCAYLVTLELLEK